MSAEDQPPKKKYEKPTLSEVALRPEEAVLGNCKAVSISGPGDAGLRDVGGLLVAGFVSASFTLDIGGPADPGHRGRRSADRRRGVGPQVRARGGRGGAAAVRARPRALGRSAGAARRRDRVRFGQGPVAPLPHARRSRVRLHVTDARSPRPIRRPPSARTSAAARSPCASSRSPGARRSTRCTIPLDEVFMVHLLARGHGVEVHGGGVVLPDGRGWLFVGVSGAGKTTLSRMWRAEPDVRVLSDERIILREEGGEIWMYGTPWHGDGHIAEPGRARLDRVFFLRHGPRNALTAVPSASDRRAPLRLRLRPVPRRGRPRLQPGLPGRGRAARALRRAGVRSRPQRGRVRARLVAAASRRRTPDVRNPTHGFVQAVDDGDRWILEVTRWIETRSAPSPTACSPLGSSSVSARVGTAWDRPCATASA